MTTSATTREPGAKLRPADIILFWFPLAATWLMMGLELPYVAAIVARMPQAAYSLAAFGVATSLAWLIESPIMMLLSAATALVRDRASYLALRRFTFILNGVVTLGMMLLAVPPVFRFVGETLMGLPVEISEMARASTFILVFWPAAIGYRRFYQGILVRHHMTRRVAYGTAIRLVTMSLTGALLLFTTELPGAILGALTLLAGVLAEAVASRWMARNIVRALMESDQVAEGTLLTLPAISRFYFPLALTSIIAMAMGPLVTFGLAHGRAPIESLAVWPVLQSMVFLFRSGGIAFQEVGIALSGAHREHEREVRSTGMMLAGAASLALALVAFTPLEAVWFQRVSGLSERLADFAVWPVRLMILVPALDFMLSIQRSRWIIDHRTSMVTAATTVEAVALAATLLIMVGGLDVLGAVGGAAAMLAGRLAANGFLLVQSWREEKRNPRGPVAL